MGTLGCVRLVQGAKRLTHDIERQRHARRRQRQSPPRLIQRAHAANPTARPPRNCALAGLLFTTQQSGILRTVERHLRD
jgi:hypothetical protein